MSDDRVSDDAIRQQLTYWQNAADTAKRPSQLAQQLVACLLELQSHRTGCVRCGGSLPPLSQWSGPACPKCVAEVEQEERIRIALDESLKLQSHYAELLNAHDGGHRIPFNSIDEWLARLRQTGKVT